MAAPTGRGSGYIRSNLLGLIAIFIALTGTAIALPGKNAVNSGDIKNGQVKGKDLAADAVSSPNVGANALTGEDIDESTLSGIPGTGGGQGGGAPSGPAGGDLTGTYPDPEIDESDLNAATVDGASIVGVTDDTDIIVGGVEVDLQCIANQTIAFVNSSVDNSQVFFELSGASAPVFDNDFDSADDVLTASSSAGAGAFTLFFREGATSEVESIELGWDTDAGCSNVEVVGQAIG